MRRTDVLISIYLPTFSAGFSVIFPFFPREFDEKSSSTKTFGFFSSKLSLDLGISSYFSWPISSFKRARARWKQFPSPLTTSFLWGGVFLDVVICLVDTLISMKTGCTYINTTEKHSRGEGVVRMRIFFHFTPPKNFEFRDLPLLNIYTYTHIYL